jgi:hypothetical protein
MSSGLSQYVFLQHPHHPVVTMTFFRLVLWSSVWRNTIPISDKSNNKSKFKNPTRICVWNLKQISKTTLDVINKQSSLRPQLDVHRRIVFLITLEMFCQGSSHRNPLGSCKSSDWFLEGHWVQSIFDLECGMLQFRATIRLIRAPMCPLVFPNISTMWSETWRVLA